jgi:peptide/nickel transport system permease protein
VVQDRYPSSTWFVIVRKVTSSTFSRVAKYTTVRVIVLLITAVVAVYLAIFVANLGGFVDRIVETNITLAIAGMRQGGWLRGVPAEEQAQIIEQTMWQMEEAAGLHEPFLIRTGRWLWRGLTLDWGEARNPPLGTRGKDAQVRALIREGLPRTLLVFGTANLLLFFSSVALALSLTKKRGGWLDRIVVALAPMGAIPTWAYSIILTFALPSGLGAMLAVGRDFDVWPDEFTLSYIPLLIKYMALPMLAIFCSGLFKSVYAWRAFFSLHVNEDYVEMARAKGLPSRLLQQRYILRPGLPSVITSLVLLLIGLWQEAIILEQFFGVSGVGERFYYAIMWFDIPMILGPSSVSPISWSSQSLSWTSSTL